MYRNEEIRNTIRQNHWFLYQLAGAVGISEPTIIRWLRTPLTDEHYNRLITGIEQLKGAASNG